MINLCTSYKLSVTVKEPITVALLILDTKVDTLVLVGLNNELILFSDRDLRRILSESAYYEQTAKLREKQDVSY